MAGVPIKADGIFIPVNEYQRVLTNGVARYERNSGLAFQETLLNPAKIARARKFGTGYDVADPKKPKAITIYQLSLADGTRLVVDIDDITSLQDNYSILATELPTYFGQRVRGAVKIAKSGDIQLINSRVAVVSIAAGGGVYSESEEAKAVFLYIVTLTDGTKIRVDEDGKAKLNGSGGEVLA